MNIKSVLSGITAFLFAITIVFGFQKQAAPEGAYEDPTSPGQCKAVFTSCELAGDEECEEPLGPNGEMVRIHENATPSPNQQEEDLTECGQPLWRVIQP